jgi:hypothetical protein
LLFCRIMKTAKNNDNVRELRVELMADTHRFLMGLDTGVSDIVLYEIFLRIKEKEQMLIKKAGFMLSPAIWNLLQSRFLNRRKVEVIDTTASHDE